MKKYFYLNESPSNKGKYLIAVDSEDLPFESGMIGSYNVLVARLLNLSYAQYLRFARDILGADLVGKNFTYIIPYYKRSNELDQFIILLNKRMELVLQEREKRFIIERNEEGELIKIPLIFEE